VCVIWRKEINQKKKLSSRLDGMDPYVPDRIERVHQRRSIPSLPAQPSSSASTLGQALLPPHCSARKQGPAGVAVKLNGDGWVPRRNTTLTLTLTLTLTPSPKSQVTRTPHAAVALGLVFIARWRGGRGLSSAFSVERTNVPDATSRGSVTWLEDPQNQLPCIKRYLSDL
jgi:hypothetical protein